MASVFDSELKCQLLLTSFGTVSKSFNCSVPDSFSHGFHDNFIMTIMKPASESYCGGQMK